MRDRLIQLFADNRNTEARAFTVRAAADSADVVEVLLYDAIVDSKLEAEWWGGVDAETFVRALRDITAGTIHLRINSPGGSVFAARAMEQALREHKAKVVVHIDGIAASAASFLAMAGEQIVMAKGAMVMIHNAWTFSMGNSADLRKTADLLEKIDGTLVQTYADRTGQKPADIAQWMADETWFTAEEAVAAGFADALADPKPADDAPTAAWNLSAYLRPPAKPAAPGQQAPNDKPAASADADAAEDEKRRMRREHAMRAMDVRSLIE